MTSRLATGVPLHDSGKGMRLIGGRRRSDGRIAFPIPGGAESELYDPIELATEGTLWSYTVQGFRPKHPYNGVGEGRDFKPFAVGYVELPEQIIVEGRIVVDDPHRLRVGMKMRLTLEAYARDPDGTDVLTYAFTPTEGQKEASP